MRIFLAGIMQGSYREMELHPQDYRLRLTEMLEKYIPGVEVYDPFRNHENSIHYSYEEGERVFLGHNYLCREMDVVLAFVPEASMGTAIEMWEGNQNGAIVVSVTPLKTNWAVKFLSHHLYDSIAELESELESGKFLERMEEIRQNLSKMRENG